MSERVRAILVTEQGHLLTIKRVKPGQAPYWVLPGGGVDSTDATLEDALHRELREELAGDADIHALVQVIDHGADRHYIYLARVHRYDFAERSGPEFAETGRGEYLLDVVPLTAAGLGGVTLVPPETDDLLKQSVTAGPDLFVLPDLRLDMAIGSY